MGQVQIGNAHGALSDDEQRKQHQRRGEIDRHRRAPALPNPGNDAQDVAAALRAVGFHGISQVEFKRDPRDGVYKLMEINPRLWQWHGLAAACGFFAAVYFAGQLDLDKKLLLLAVAAALLGALVDLAFRPTQKTGLVLGIVFGIVACWIFISILGRMPAQKLALHAVGLGVLVATMVAFSMLSYDEPPAWARSSSRSSPARVARSWARTWSSCRSAASGAGTAIGLFT